MKRRPAGPSASKTRVSPPFTCTRLTSSTATKSTPSRCAPSGVGRPMPSVVSMRNWCASTNHGCARLHAEHCALSARSRRDHTGCATHVGVHRLEPALQPAVQRVVFERLPVRAVRHLPAPHRLRRQSRNGAGADSGRRRAGRRRVAGRPTRGATHRARQRRRQQLAQPLGLNAACPRTRMDCATAAGDAARARCAAPLVGRPAARRLPARRWPLPTPPPFVFCRRRRCGAGRCRTARTGSRSNTTRCTAGWSAGSSRCTPTCWHSRCGHACFVHSVRSVPRGLRAQPWFVEAHQFPHRHHRRHRAAHTEGAHDASTSSPCLREPRAGEGSPPSSKPTARPGCASR